LKKREGRRRGRREVERMGAVEWEGGGGMQKSFCSHSPFLLVSLRIYKCCFTFLTKVYSF